ncbi:hypothetical protein GPECTOR_74g711 [Gonium pectorale]|uniref:Uncharacterized protein n=1 Tax=Gonium pectorale TaxID=33097 RepID=A0A150G2L9_GONPE|nr:hypothetical protein GPECTOR_74g711 [Gonium pectorale]|eukprot:KXZ44097.1 hypothetical protein GPECTOR_74g711 [Gonium pectorale]
MAAALASDSDAEPQQDETPGFELKSQRARRGAARGAQAADAAPAVAPAASGADAAGPSGTAEPAQAAQQQGAGKGRNKAGKGAKAGQGQDAAQPASLQPTGVSSDAADGAAGKGAHDARAMPPPKLPPPRQRGAAAADADATEAAADDTDVLMVPATQDADLMASQPPTQQHMSQPATLPQPPLQGPTGRAAAAPASTSQQLPANSSMSIFSQSFRQYEPLMAKNPLAALNPRVVEQAKNRMRLIPYAALQQTKSMAKLVPPSMLKGQAAAQQAAAKRPLPQLTQGQLAAAGPSVVPGDVMPPDMLLRSLQQPPSKVAKR